MLDDEHEEIFQKMNVLQSLLTNLRYEGKPRLGKNLKDVGKALAFLKEKTKKHFLLEEKVIFPFLETHIPRLNPVLRLFESEHQGFQCQLRNLEVSLKEASKKRVCPESGQSAERIRENGIHMIAFLRYHLQAENGTIYRSSEMDLRPDEIALLKKEIQERSDLQ